LVTVSHRRLWDASDGYATMLITLQTCRDKKLRLFDPRAGIEAVRTAEGHSGVKGSRSVFLGDRDRIVTTGVGCCAESSSSARCPTDKWDFGIRAA